MDVEIAALFVFVLWAIILFYTFTPKKKFLTHGEEEDDELDFNTAFNFVDKLLILTSFEFHNTFSIW